MTLKDKQTLGIVIAYGLAIISIVLAVILKSHADTVDSFVDLLWGYSDQDPITTVEVNYHDPENHLSFLMPYYSTTTHDLNQVTDIHLYWSYIFGTQGKIIVMVTKTSLNDDGTKSTGWGPFALTIELIDGTWQITETEIPI